MFEVRCAWLVYFVEVIETTHFRAHFNISRIRVKKFRKWIMFWTAVPAKKIANVIRAEAGAIFETFEANNICELLWPQP